MRFYAGAVAVGFAFIAAQPALARNLAPLAVLPLHDQKNVGLTIDATVEGRPGQFLFDTGWGVTAVTPTVAALIGCRPWGQVTAFRAIGERIDAKRCNAASFRIGEFQARAPEVLVLDVMKYLPPGTAPLSGGIGLDLFAGCTITIQSHAHRVVVESQASEAARIRNAQEVPVRPVRDAEGAALTIDVAVPTADGEAWMELDTGNNGPTLIGNHLAEQVGLKRGLDGRQQLTMALAPRAIVKDKAFTRDLILDGDIGRGVLDHWDLTLDLTKGKAWFTPAAD